MAMVNSYNSKMRKSLPKQAMLKDYLLEDLSSCSSNGFHSFPRRPCCPSTVRFNPNQKQKALQKNKPNSLLQKVITAAAKLLSTKPPENSPAKSRSSILPRGISRRFKLWKPIKYFAVTNAVHNSDKCEGEEWGGGDYLQCSSHVFVSEIGDVSGSPEKEVSGGEGVTVGGGSGESAISTPASSTENKWRNEEAKEQFSPVCVLDFPSMDDEEVSSPEEISSPFQSSLDCVEGRKKKLMQKLRRFEGLAKLEPMNLSKKFSLSEQTDESIDYPPPSPSDHVSILQEDLQVEQDGGDVALDLLDQIKTTLKNFKYDYEIILFDFFNEGISKKNGIKFENKLISEARDWMNGNPREMYLGWEEVKNRIPYMRDIEKGGKWNFRALDEHKEEVALEFEVEVLDLLMNELVIDLI